MAHASLVVPIALIALGVGWLLSVLGVAPDINWLWTIGLAITGVFALLASGIDKVSVVVGPFFMIMSLLSVLRQSGYISLDIEVPILVIVAGVLSLVSRTSGLPTPKWFDEAQLPKP